MKAQIAAGSGQTLLGAVLTIPTQVSMFWPVFGVWAAGVAASFYFQPSRTAFAARLRYAVGFLLAMDFLIIWMPWIAFQGTVFKLFTAQYLRSIYDAMDRSPLLRKIAETCFYEKAKHSDYFATQLLFVLNFIPNLAFIFYIQLTHGYITWWALAAYYLNWVGIGSRCLGAAYTMSHKEGHAPNMYKSWIRDAFGNVFENWVGLFYGNVWNNFTTTHIALHHRLDSGQGDTLYCWDCNRASWPDVLIYMCRGLLHMSGFGALYQFWRCPDHIGHERHFKALRRGVVIYWVLLPIAVFCATRSASFYFWVVIQPLVCMSFFLSLMNLGFHAFIQNDENGNRIQCVESITLLGGQDDFFGENDHMAHHYHTNVYWRDLDDLQAKQHKEWALRHASTFKDIDIVTFSAFVVLKAWPLLAERYVDYSGTLTKAEVENLLERRATRREMEHRYLLPAIPTPARPQGYGPEPDQVPQEGSATYCRLLKRLRAMQLGLARHMEQALPPAKKEWPKHPKQDEKEVPSDSDTTASDSQERGSDRTERAD